MWDWIKRQFGRPAEPESPSRLSVPQTGTDADVPAVSVGEHGARWLALHEPRPGEQGLPRGKAHACGKCGAPLSPILLTSWGSEAWESMPIVLDGWRCTGCAAMSAPAFLTPEQANALCECGARAGQAGRLDEAEFFFRRVCGSWSDYSVARMQLGSVYLDRRSRELSGEARPEVLDAYEARALSELLAASSGHPLPHPWVHLKLAHILSCRGEDAQATEHLQRLAAHPDAAPYEEEARHIEGYIARRVLLYERGTALIMPHIQLHERPGADVSAVEDVQRGIALLRAFSDHNPTHWQSLWILGKGAQVLGDADAALSDFAACWALQPPDVNVGREYGSALLVAGRLEDAVAVMRKTLAMAPEDAGLMSNLALGLLLVSRDDEAVRYIRAARRQDPDDEICIALETLIQEVQCAIRPRPVGMGADGALRWPG